MGSGKINDLSRFGNLVLYLPKNIIESLDKTSLKVIIDNQLTPRSCICLPEQERKIWKNALQRAYGPLQSWNAATLVKISNFLWILDDTDFEDLDRSEFSRATPFMLNTTCLGENIKYKAFSGFSGPVSFSEACESWLSSQEDKISFKKAETVLMRKYLFNSQMLVDQALSLSEIVNNTTPRSPNTEVLLAKITPAQVSFFFNATQRMVFELYDTQKFTLGQRLAFGDVIEKISKTHQQNLADILQVNVADLPTDGNQLGPYIQDKLENNLLTDDQIQDIRDEATKNRIHYTKDMIRIFDFSEDDYQTDRITFCKFSDCIVLPNDESAVQKLYVPYVPDLKIPEKIENMKIPSRISCRGMIAAEASAIAISAEDLKEWTDEELYNCLDVIGNIKWPTHTKTGVWNLLFTRLGNKIIQSNHLKEDMLLFLNELLDVIAVQNVDLVSTSNSQILNSPDHLSKLGEKILSKDALTKIANNYIAANNLNNTKTRTEDDVLGFASLGSIICGMPNEIVDSYISSTKGKRLDLLSLIGVSVNNCPNNQMLEMLAEKASLEWPIMLPENVAMLGIIIAGLTPTQLSSLSVDSLSSVTPAALAHFTKEHFESLCLEQFASLPLETQLDFSTALNLKYPSTALELKDCPTRRADVDIRLPNEPIEQIEPSKPIESQLSSVVTSWKFWLVLGLAVFFGSCIILICAIKCLRKQKNQEITPENGVEREQ